MLSKSFKIRRKHMMSTDHPSINIGGLMVLACGARMLTSCYHCRVGCNLYYDNCRSRFPPTIQMQQEVFKDGGMCTSKVVNTYNNSLQKSGQISMRKGKHLKVVCKKEPIRRCSTAIRGKVKAFILMA